MECNLFITHAHRNELVAEKRIEVHNNSEEDEEKTDESDEINIDGV